MIELLWYSLGTWALAAWGTEPVFAMMLAVMVSIVTLNRVLTPGRILRWHQPQGQRPADGASRSAPLGEAPWAPLGVGAVRAPSEEAEPDEGDDGWRTYTTEVGTIVHELGEPSKPLGDAEHRDLLLRLRLELAEARAQAEALRGDAVARIQGRLHSWRGPVAVLAVADGDGHQRILVGIPDADEREALAVGTRVEVIARFTGGRLVAERFIEAEADSSAVPELPEPLTKPASIPAWFDSKAANEKRPFLKASDGSSSVSELRVHLVWATKRRGAVLTAPMIDRLKTLTAEAVKEKALGRLLAVNGETDHVHVALWLPANLSGSEAAGMIKAYTSRHLRREFPELKAHHEEALWQRGCFVGSIGAAGHLEGVLSYIAQQNTPQASQADQEGALPLAEGEEASDA